MKEQYITPTNIILFKVYARVHYGCGRARGQNAQNNYHGRSIRYLIVNNNLISPHNLDGQTF
jgi:hypothetical protein